MGKLGGREIGYGSDLDIFFVYEPGDDDDGSKSERYVRAAQRVLRLVSAPHGDGPGYELDTRLRPSGSHGLLVVSLEAFARYHGLSADGTPHGSQPDGAGLGAAGARQGAPVRRRRASSVVASSSLATKIAYERGAPDPERVNHLRMRMEKELAREAPHRYDVKLGRGGIVDVEFAVQWLQMKHGADPRVRTTDTETALGALEACGYLEASTAAVLREGYALLRRLEQALRVVHGTSASLIEEGAPGVAALARRMGFRDGPTTASQRSLFERYRAVTRDVRAAYLSVLGIARAQGSAMNRVDLGVAGNPAPGREVVSGRPMRAEDPSSPSRWSPRAVACGHRGRAACRRARRWTLVRPGGGAAAGPPQYVVADPSARSNVVALPLGSGGALGLVVDKTRIVVGRGEPHVGSDVPEAPLAGVRPIPSRMGGGYLFWTENDVYRADAFDAPLKPLARFADAIQNMSLAPKFLLVRTSNGERWALGLPSGERVAIDPLGASDVEGLDDGRALVVQRSGRGVLEHGRRRPLGRRHLADQELAHARRRRSTTSSGSSSRAAAPSGSSRTVSSRRSTSSRPSSPPRCARAIRAGAAPRRRCAPRSTTARRSTRAPRSSSSRATSCASTSTPARSPASSRASSRRTRDARPSRPSNDVLFACVSRGAPQSGGSPSAFVVSHTLSGDAPTIEQTFPDAGAVLRVRRRRARDGRALRRRAGGLRTITAFAFGSPAARWQDYDVSALGERRRRRRRQRRALDSTRGRPRRGRRARSDAWHLRSAQRTALALSTTAAATCSPRGSSTATRSTVVAWAAA